VEKKAPNFWENIKIWGKFHGIFTQFLVWGLLFVSFLQFGQFSTNVLLINAKSFLEWLGLMLHQKAGK
jgi:hypothetical protein